MPIRRVFYPLFSLWLQNVAKFNFKDKTALQNSESAAIGQSKAVRIKAAKLSWQGTRELVEIGRTDLKQIVSWQKCFILHCQS